MPTPRLAASQRQPTNAPPVQQSTLGRNEVKVSRKTSYTPKHAHAGDIGADPREIEFEPIEEPVSIPEPAPIEVPEPELVPV